MMRCARCCQVFYCDVDCQKAHWAAHRAACKEAAVAIAVERVDSEKDLGGAAALHRAADAGDAGAMTRLGLCYEYGQGGVDVDAAEAARWYTRAVEAHDPPASAYYNLGNYNYFGCGSEKNLPEAARLFRIAAEMGDLDAQHNLGVCLERGEGVPRNPVEAFTWQKRAADAGHPEALCSVGVALLYGLGVPEDKPAAIEYYRRAADQGDETATYNLGVCYETGDGVPRNLPQAVAWYTRARDAGHPGAVKRLAEIAPRLTPKQRAAADQLLATPLPRPSAPTVTAGAGGAGAPTLTRADVLTMGTGALKRLLQGRGVDTAGIIEKAQLVELALAAIGEAPL